VKKFLESLTIIVGVLALSLADSTPVLVSVGWIVAAIALAGATVYLGGFHRGE
jgi:hypothetical protein